MSGARAGLLGSIATSKYGEVLLEVFGDRLWFPAEFIGRGDMSRGALLLRQARAGEELSYLTVRGTVDRGRRAPRLGDRCGRGLISAGTRCGSLDGP